MALSVLKFSKFTWDIPLLLNASNAIISTFFGIISVVPLISLFLNIPSSKSFNPVAFDKFKPLILLFKNAYLFISITDDCIVCSFVIKHFSNAYLPIFEKPENVGKYITFE